MINLLFSKCLRLKKQSDEKVYTTKSLGKINNYGYNIETESRDFTFGVPLVVHNTDLFFEKVFYFNKFLFNK